MIRQLSTLNQNGFFTPERFAYEQTRQMESSRGKLLIAGCRAGTYLSTKIAQRYNELLAEAGSQNRVLHLPSIDHRFSDTETCVRLDLHVGGYDVFLIQALLNPLAGCSV